jgi:hypothetical protein
VELDKLKLDDERIQFEIKRNLQKEFDDEKEELIASVVRQIEGNKAKKDVQSSELQRLKDRLTLEFNEEYHSELRKKEKLLKINYQRKLEDGKKAIQEKMEAEWREKILKEQSDIINEKENLSLIKISEQTKLKKLEDERRQRRKLLEEKESTLQAKVEELRGKIYDLSQRVNSRNEISKETNFTSPNRKANKIDLKEEEKENSDHKLQSPNLTENNSKIKENTLFEFKDEQTQQLAENILFEISKR